MIKPAFTLGRLRVCLYAVTVRFRAIEGPNACTHVRVAVYAQRSTDPEKYRRLGHDYSRTQKSTNDSDPTARSHSRQIRLLIWNQLENTGATGTIYQAEYVLTLAIGFILTNWNLVCLCGKDGTIEYSPNVLEYPRVRLGKYNSTCTIKYGY